MSCVLAGASACVSEAVTEPPTFVVTPAVNVSTEPLVHRDDPRLVPRSPEPTWFDRDDARFAALSLTAPDEGVPYDCRGVHPDRAAWASEVSGPVADLVALADPASSDGLETTPDLILAVERVAEADPESMSGFERVLVQNAALSIGIRNDSDDERLHAGARTIVERFALTATDLDALGSEPDASVDRWIGARERWVDRKGLQCGDGRLLRHDRAYGGVRAFRPVRVGETRALVSQLVAIDTEGHAHVTPYIGQIELRRGLGRDASACVIEIDREALVGGAPGGLRRVDMDHLPHTRFIRRTGDGLGCRACHSGSGQGDFDDVSAEAAGSLLMNRRNATRELLERQIPAWMWPRAAAL